MKGMHLAELNVARLRYAPEDARVAPFMRALDAVNGVGERSDGFVWRFVADTAAGDVPEETGDPRLIPNLSVWVGVAPLEHFVWNTVHRQFYARRAEWFELLEGMHFAMWWVAPGEVPTMEEAMARLAHLEAHGDSDHAFGWRWLEEAQLWRTARCDGVAAE